MAYRSTKRQSWRNLKPAQVLPIWTTTHSNAANIVVSEMFARIGVTDIRTYFQQLRAAIVICVIVGACMGASMGASGSAVKGLLIGAILGVVTPAALIWLGTMLTMIVIFLAVYCAVWAAIFCFGWWILGAMFGG